MFLKLLNFKETVGESGEVYITTSKLKMTGITAQMDGNYECRPQYGTYIIDGESVKLTILRKTC